jgi:hypothetical protein
MPGVVTQGLQEDPERAGQAEPAVDETEMAEPDDQEIEPLLVFTLS